MESNFESLCANKHLKSKFFAPLFDIYKIFLSFDQLGESLNWQMQEISFQLKPF